MFQKDKLFVQRIVLNHWYVDTGPNFLKGLKMSVFCLEKTRNQKFISLFFTLRKSVKKVCGTKRNASPNQDPSKYYADCRFTQAKKFGFKTSCTSIFFSIFHFILLL